jgi:site-specific DNA recombinase
MDQAVAICRVSTRQQRDEGHSLEHQEKSVREAAEGLGCEIIHVISLDESSRSGKNLKRKDLEEARELCLQNPRVKYLLFDKVNRFMREVDIFYWYIVEFRSIGATVYFCDPSQHDLNGGDQLATLKRFLAIYEAEADNRERSETVTTKMKARVAEGYYPFRVHQGYRPSDTPGFHVPDPARFPLLQQAFHDVLSLSYTPAQALKRLNDLGYVQPTNGQPLRIDKFAAILRDPYYAGALWIGDWPHNDAGLHEPMITLGERDHLIAILDARRIKYERKQNNPEFPLNKTLCADCGGKLVGFFHSNGKGGSWPKYRCRTCGKQHRREDIHEALDKLLRSLKIHWEAQTRLKAALREKWSEMERDNHERIKALQKRSQSLQDRKQKLVVALAESSLDLKPDITDSIERTKAEIEALEAEIAEAKASFSQNLSEFVEDALGFVEDLRANWWNLEPEDRLRCKLLIFPKGFSISNAGKVYTPEISPIFALASHSGNKKDLPEQESPFWWT